MRLDDDNDTKNNKKKNCSKMLTTHDQIVQVKKVLQEDEERFDYLLQLLENWMDCHDFIPRNYDKQMLPIYLRNCKYNLNKTKLKLELYFVYKKRYPNAFCYSEFTDAEKSALENYYIIESSKLTLDGCRVVCTGFRSTDTTGSDLHAVNKFTAMFATYKASHDVINGGVIVVVNYKYLSPSMVPPIVTPFYKLFLSMMQKICPFRIRGIYITFLPRFAVPIANIVKMMFNEKIRNRIHIEAGNEEMKKHVPLDCLPKEFGGTDGNIDEKAAKLVQEIMQAKPWFQEQEKHIVGNIPKDVYDISAIDEHFGAQGSFRKIDID